MGIGVGSVVCEIVVEFNQHWVIFFRRFRHRRFLCPFRIRRFFSSLSTSFFRRFRHRRFFLRFPSRGFCSISISSFFRLFRRPFSALSTSYFFFLLSKSRFLSLSTSSFFRRFRRPTIDSVGNAYSKLCCCIMQRFDELRPGKSRQPGDVTGHLAVECPVEILRCEDAALSGTAPVVGQRRSVTPTMDTLFLSPAIVTMTLVTDLTSRTCNIPLTVLFPSIAPVRCMRFPETAPAAAPFSPDAAS